MIYILAGNECTGKTTLFDMLKKSTALHPETTFIKESHTNRFGAKSCRIMYFTVQSFESERAIIYDRATVLDDMVYSEVIDGEKSPFYRDCYDALRNARHCYKIIYLDTDIEVLKERLAARGDEFIKPEQLVEIKESYERVLRTLPATSIVRIDASGDRYDTYNKVMEVILENEGNENCGDCSGQWFRENEK